MLLALSLTVLQCPLHTHSQTSTHTDIMSQRVSLSESHCPLQRLDSINEDIIKASRLRLDHIGKAAVNPPTQHLPA